MKLKIINNLFRFIKKIVLNIIRSIIWLFKDIYRKKLRIALAIGLAVGAFYLWGLSSSLLWGLFLVFLFCCWDSRFIASLALICLIACPILLQVKQDEIAEEVAVYAYFFLVMVVVLQIFEYWREGREEKKKGLGKDKKKPLLLSEKIKLVVGDYHSFIKDVKHSSLKLKKELKENNLIEDRGEDKEEKVQMSLIQEEKEDKIAVGLDLYEDYSIMDVKKKKTVKKKKKDF